jgi:phosphate-selective porin OprO/OprP
MFSKPIGYVVTLVVRSTKAGSLTAVLLAISFGGTSVRAQQPQPQTPPTAVATGFPAPTNYLNPTPADPDVRLQILAQTVKKQQTQLALGQDQIAALTQQLNSGGSANGGAQGGNQSPSFFPGSAVASPDVGDAAKGTYVVGSDRRLKAIWTNDGPVFASRNGDFTFHPRFVSQLDFVGVKNPAANIGVPGANAAGTLDSVDFRRLRMGCDGTMWDTVEYVLEFDYAAAMATTDPTVASTQQTGLRSTGTASPTGGTPSSQSGNVVSTITPTTTFLIFRQLPVLSNVRLGQQQDWFSLEHIESARFLDFMERSPIFDAFAGPNNAGYVPGISTFKSYLDDNLQVQLGAYKTTMYTKEFPYDIGNNDYTYGGRVVATPYYDEPSQGRYLVHLAVAGEQRHFNTELNPNMNGDNMRLRTRGDLRNTTSQLTPNYTDTGNFYATGQGVCNTELAIQWGSLLIQGEYCMCWMENAAVNQGGRALNNVFFNGGYLEALYFLTGENRPYLREAGVFGRTTPNQNGWLVKGAGFGRGAWQVGARYDFMDLNSGGINGGQLQDMTLGLNWFINPNARFQLNYVLTHVNNTAAITGPVPAGAGALSGSKFTGEGCISSIGVRQDFSF